MPPIIIAPKITAEIVLTFKTEKLSAINFYF
jgi:hypothetical protein